MIDDFVNLLCDILDIREPKISFDISDFTTNTMLAQYDPKSKTIYLKNLDTPNLDQLFAISHELRHIWQIQTNKQLFFSEYKPVELCNSIEEYNLQSAEIDANAFAGMIMIHFFKVKPLYTGLSDNVKTKISSRLDVIRDDYF